VHLSVPTPVNTPEILYRLKALNGDLLYVGITRDFPARLKQHQSDKPWFAEVRHIELVHVDGTRAQIEAIEKAVIKAEAPRYNVVHNGEVRRTLAAPVKDESFPPVERDPLFWREEDDGYNTYFYDGDRVFIFGRLATLLDIKGEAFDYLVHFDGDGGPTLIDGTCHIRHALPDDKDLVW
jgi:predicted GIY-YIG superfamily endonuclease